MSNDTRSRPMTTETIHTCSYECERPGCIRAQRDELAAKVEALRAEVERLRAEVARLEVIAGYGGVSSDAPERLILASEVYDGVQSCDKWCDVRRVVDDGQPMPESATAYVRADRAERLAEALREATAMLLADYPETAKRLRALLRGQEEDHEQ